MSTVRQLKLRGVNYDNLLDILAQRVGVIYEKAPEHFQFAHRTFQEYLCASYLSRAKNYPSIAINEFYEDPILWREVGELLPEEVHRQGLDLWALIKGLLPNDYNQLPEDPQDKTWYRILYVSRLIRDEISETDEQHRIYRPKLRDSIIRLIQIGALPPVERAEIGRLLAKIGDTRPGVGLKEDLLPDIDWVSIEAGPFLFGPDDKTLDLPDYQISRYPVTYKQFKSFIDAKDGYSNKEWWEGLAEQFIEPEKAEWPFDNNPRERVNWYEAVAFCRWLSAKMGYEIRLPTEEEWEKAARGKEGFIFPYGNSYDLTKANTSETGIGQASAVGIFPDGKSPYSLCDMSGNIQEYCLTKWGKTSSDITGRIDPRGSDLRVVKGGGFSSSPLDSRALVSYSRSPHNRGGGFRIVRFRELGIERLLKTEHNIKPTNLVSNALLPSIQETRESTTNRIILQKEKTRFFAVSIDSSGNYLAVGGSNHRVSVISLNRLVSKRIEETPDQNSNVRCLKFHHINRLIMYGTEDGIVRLEYPFPGEFQIIGNHSGAVLSLAFNPLENLLASGGQDGEVKIWKVQPDHANNYHVKIGSELEIMVNNNNKHGEVFSLDFNPEGNLLALSYADGTIYIYDLIDKRLQPLAGFIGAVFSVRFNHNGTLIAASGSDRTVRVWDVKTLKSTVFYGHKDKVRSVSFHPSSRFLASSSKDETIRLWDLMSETHWVFKGHNSYVYNIEFHKDGLRMISASGDGTVREWPLPNEVLALLEAK